MLDRAARCCSRGAIRCAPASSPRSAPTIWRTRWSRPFEMTAPKLLKERDYQSALFGKFHLGLQGNSPFGDAMPRSLGWDYFFGWLDASGDPSSIDTKCGRRGPGRNLLLRICAGSRGRRSRPRRLLLARRYLPASWKGIGPNPPGRACRDGGGIFDPNQSCKTQRPANIDFTLLSAHYVSPLW